MWLKCLPSMHEVLHKPDMWLTAHLYTRKVEVGTLGVQGQHGRTLS